MCDMSLIGLPSEKVEDRVLSVRTASVEGIHALRALQKAKINNGARRKQDAKRQLCLPSLVAF